MNKEKLLSNLKVALVYDHLTTLYGGAELVLQTLHTAFPTAPIYTSVYDLDATHWTAQCDIKTSFLQKIPIIKKYHALLAPLHPLAFESFDLSKYDIIISVSNGAAKGILTLPHQLHVCYLLTPTRYLQTNHPETQVYLESHKIFSVPGMKKLASPFFKYLNYWDNIASWRPDRVVAISKLVGKRISEVYRREVDKVLYPPFFKQKPASNPTIDTDFFLCLTRLTSYKRIDLAIKACLQKNKTLIIAGDGVYKNNLLRIAGSHAYVRMYETVEKAVTTASASYKSIIFMGTCSEEEKNALLSQCSALLMPGEEDFGLVGLEAAAHGKPVLTNGISGIAEVLHDSVHAIHISDTTEKAIIKAIEKFETTQFSAEKIKETAKKYESKDFITLFSKTIYQFWQQHSTISQERSTIQFHTK